MPRPKGVPTKVVRLPVALLEPFEAEARRSGKPIADVLAARLGATAAPSAQPSRSATPAACVKAPMAAASLDSSRGLNANGHLSYCKCSMCKPPEKGGKR